jgi:hypothetical protein
VHTTPITIPGIAGWVSVTLPPMGRATLTINGLPAQRLNGSDFLLPGITGVPILVKLKRAWFEPFPQILTVDASYPTGPPLPGYLKALMLLPIVLIPISGLLLGAIVGLPAFIANMSVSRSTLTPGRKGAAIAAIDFGALLALILIISGLIALGSLAGL